MKKLVLIRTAILGLLLLIAVVSNAQQEKVTAAYTFLQQNDLDNAKANIDDAVVDPETANDAQAWYLRGFIYKTIYTKREKINNQSPARLEALNSFKKSLSLDVEKEFFTDNIENIKNLINTLHNDAASSLDPFDYKTAIKLFEKHQEYYKIVDPSPENIQAKQIEFDIALVSVYNSVIENGKTDSLRAYKFLNLAKNIYSKILTIDPNNIMANYGMGILYYNQAVNLLKTQDWDLDIVNMDVVQSKAVILFKESLPFMEKAYTLDPERVDAIQGMSGIYFGLNEPEKSNIYRLRLQEIKKPK